MALLLVGSAFFSASETALFTIPRHNLKKLQEKAGFFGRSIKVLLGNQRALLVTILLGNMFVNVLYSSLAVLYGASLVEKNGYQAFVIVNALALASLIIVGEVLPKSIAVNIPLPVSRLCAPVLLVFRAAILPARVIFEKLVRTLTTVILRNKKEEITRPEDLANLLEIGGEYGLLTPWEKKMLDEVIEFSDIEVREVMTPRINATLCSLHADRSEILSIIKSSKHAKIPLWRGERDNVIGVVHSKDIFLNPDKTLDSLVRPVLFFPETAKIDYILRTLMTRGQTIAMVVDEYGGLEGIVTIEDLVEEIVGEIEDEFDRSSAKVSLLSNGRFLVPADITLREWNDIAGTSLADDKIETIGGIVALRLDRIPRKGDSVVIEGFKFKVLRTANKTPRALLAEKVRRQPKPGKEGG